MTSPKCSSRSLSYLQVTLFCSALVDVASGPTGFNVSDKTNFRDLGKFSSMVPDISYGSEASRFGQHHRRMFNKSFYVRWRRTTSYQLGDFENPIDGEIGMLWLPYVVFTVVLLSLIFLSFMKFHCQRGDQYRRRRAEMEDKPILNEIKEAQEKKNDSCTNHLKKGFELAKYSTIAKTVPDHLSLFLKFSQLDEIHSGITPQPWFQRRHSFDDPALAQIDKNHTSHSSAPYDKSLPSEAQTTLTDTKYHNVAYTFNANGSMVDVRCSNGEKSYTFLINRDATTQALTRNGLESAVVSHSSTGSKKNEGKRTEKDKAAVDFKTKLSMNSKEKICKHLNKKITLVKMVDAATSPGLFFKSKANGSNVYRVHIP